MQDDPDADPQWDSCSVLSSKTCVVISSAISTSPPGLLPQGGKELITTSTAFQRGANRGGEHRLGSQTVLGLQSGFCTYQLGDLGQVSYLF